LKRKHWNFVPRKFQENGTSRQFFIDQLGVTLERRLKFVKEQLNFLKKKMEVNHDSI
jgi:hypothetical protein